MRRIDTRIELLRVVGALSVFLYHFMGDVENLLRPAFSHNAFWVVVREGAGPFGVSLFIVISGVAFSWACSRPGGATGFIRRRLAALFPLYWWIALPLIIFALAAHRMPLEDLWKVPVWLSGLGIVSANTFFPVVDGWWYMTLALQIVLAYPLLKRIQESVGVHVFVLGSAVVTLTSVWTLRTLGWHYAIGGFLGARLLEFAAGMTIGGYSGIGARVWPRPSVLMAMGVALAVCSTGLPGHSLRIALAPALVWFAVGIKKNILGAWGKWVSAAGSLSFAFYLSHSPWAKPILSLVADESSSGLRIAIAGVLVLAVAVLIALVFQGSFLWANGLWETFCAKHGPCARGKEESI